VGVGDEDEERIRHGGSSYQPRRASVTANRAADS
jgi:hypothetical protein